MRTLRQLADMLSPFVHRFQERVQSVGEGLVTGAASEPTGFFEVGLRVPADRTFLCRCALLNFFRGADAKQQIGERETSWVLHALLFRASVAQIHLLHFALQDLRQENRRIIAFANVAQHFCTLLDL
jgi:hypothetical protein